MENETTPPDLNTLVTAILTTAATQTATGALAAEAISAGVDAASTQHQPTPQLLDTAGKNAAALVFASGGFTIAAGINQQERTAAINTALSLIQIPEAKPCDSPDDAENQSKPSPKPSSPPGSTESDQGTKTSTPNSTTKQQPDDSPE